MIRISSILSEKISSSKTIQVQGWIKNRRVSKQVTFVTLNDGSCLQNLQIVIDHNFFSEDDIKKFCTGASLSISGYLTKSQGKKQAIELQAQKIDVLGHACPDTYFLQPKKHSLVFLREKVHLRMKTSTFGAIFRIRHALSMAIHQFFHEKKFLWIHTPIITPNDAEGAGELFQVTTLPLAKIPQTEKKEVDFDKDFFSQKCNLTVSGQLHGEVAAMAFSNIYTFGPTFRAEDSNTSRHLAEFWMVEPEMAFYDLEKNIDFAINFLQYIIQYVLKNCQEDIYFLAQREEESKTKKANSLPMLLLEKLQQAAKVSYIIITYTEAIEILSRSAPNKKKKFKFPVKWGIDLQAEHERYLVEKHFQKPVVITHFPKGIKAFYMRQNADEKTVAAMDILFPGIGEIIGGSQREERYEQLIQAMQYFDINQKKMDWYLDTRRFGTVPHSGFGLGFERLMLFITGMDNIRDVIPFPRTPGSIIC